MTCPKCGFNSEKSFSDCPKCGLLIDRYIEKTTNSNGTENNLSQKELIKEYKDKSKTKICFECISLISQAAKVCKFCGSRIEGKLCTDCYSICHSNSKKCKWCGKHFRKDATKDIHIKSLNVASSFWGTLFVRQSIFPQKIRLNNEKIVITTLGFLGLSSNDEEILWEKVSGFSYKSGIIWDHIWIETRGQTSAVISSLYKEDGKKIRKILQSLEK